jgi:hypothetical protein
MNESDTPISDQWLKGYDDNEMTLDAYRVMQELECALTAARELVKNLEITVLSLMMENKTITEQRDRLAEAFRKFVILTERMSSGIEVGNDLIVAWDIADEALQSLNH